jgi:RND family efflux transporter MFP subunit
MLRTFGAIAYLAVGFLTIGGCRRTSETTVAPLEVTVAVARIDTLRDVASGAGTIVPTPAAEWTVVAPAEAEVLDVRKPNDTVAPGDVLVRLDIPSATQEMATLELAVLEASTRVDRANTALARQTSLNARGLTSRNDFDAAKLEQASAETALVAAKTHLEATKASSNASVIRARFGGVVTEVFHAVGDPVRPAVDDPILRVVDPTRVQVLVQVPLTDLARILPTQTATVQAPTVGPVAATVVTKADALSGAATSGEVRLAFSAPASLPIGTPVSAEIVLDVRANALVVPSAAVQREEGVAWVMTIGDDGLARRRDVRVGMVTRALVQVVAGLQPGERVITSSPEDVPDGAPVVVAN